MTDLPALDDDRLGRPTYRVGAVAYKAQVVTIWEAFRRWFHERGLPLEYVLFSTYEEQVDALAAGWIDVAWNTNLAYVATLDRTDGRGHRVSSWEEVVIRVDVRHGSRGLGHTRHAGAARAAAGGARPRGDHRGPAVRGRRGDP